ncbi:MAG: DUF3310 domain-containing protein [Bacteroidales bacterium]|nr:DUF3310 domain-containing protein [Bacteroidales bacterium]
MNEQDNCTPLHYQYDITPQEYADANHLPFDEGNVVKYVTRHKLKNGYDDIIKAIHYCMFILKRDYNISSHLSSYNEAGNLKQLHVYKNGNQ